MAEDTIKRLLVKLTVDTSEFEAAIKKLKQEMSDLQAEGQQKSQARKQAIQEEVAAKKQGHDIVKKVLETATEYVAKLEMQETVSSRVIELTNTGLEGRKAEVELEEALLRLIVAESQFTADNLRNLEKELEVDRERLAVNQAQLRMQTTGIAGPVAAKPTSSAVATTTNTIKQAEELKAVSVIELSELQKVVQLERARTDVLSAQAKVLLTQKDYRKQEISLVMNQLESEKLLLAALERRLGLEERLAVQKGGRSSQAIGPQGRIQPNIPQVQEKPIARPTTKPVETMDVNTIQTTKLQLLNQQVAEHQLFVSQLEKELQVSEKLLASKQSEEGTTKRELASIQSEVSERTKSLEVAQKQLSVLEQKQSQLQKAAVTTEKNRIQNQIEQEITTKAASMTGVQVAERQKEIQQELALLNAKRNSLSLTTEQNEVSKISAAELQKEYDTQTKRLRVEQDILRTRQGSNTPTPAVSKASVTSALGMAAESAAVSEMSQKQAAAKMEELGAERQLLAVEQARLQLELKRGVLDKTAVEEALKLIGVRKQENLLAMEQVRLATAKAGEGIFTGIRESLSKMVEGIAGHGGLFGQIAAGAFTGFVGAEIFTGVIEQVHKLGEALIEASGRAGELKLEFTKIAQDRGADPTELIGKLRVATRGLVDDTKLYEISGRFMRQNMNVTTEQITKLIGTTLDLATATGRTTPEAMNALERASASGQMRMLGYVTGLSNADFALRGLTGSISPAARNTLQFNQILLAEEAALRKVVIPATTLPELFQQIRAAEKNFIDDMAEGVITSGEFGKNIADVSKWLMDIHPQLESLAKSIGEGLATGIKFVVSHMNDLKVIMETLVAIKILDWTKDLSLGMLGLAGSVEKLLLKLGLLKDAEIGVTATTAVEGAETAAIATAGTGAAVAEGAAGGGIMASLSTAIPWIAAAVGAVIVILGLKELLDNAAKRSEKEQSEAEIKQFERYGAVTPPNAGLPKPSVSTFMLGSRASSFPLTQEKTYQPPSGPTPGGISEEGAQNFDMLHGLEDQFAKEPKPQVQPPLDLQSVQQAIEIAKLKQKVAEEHAKTLLEITKQELADEEDATKRAFERGLLSMKDYTEKEKALKRDALAARLKEIDQEEAAQKAAIDQESIAKRKIDQAKLDQLTYAQGTDKKLPIEDYASQVAAIKQAMDLEDSVEVKKQRYAVVDAQTEQKRVAARAQTNREILAEDDKLLEDEIAARKTYDSAITKAQKESTTEQEQLLEKQFGEGLVSAKAYIDQRTALIERQRDIQLQELTQEEQDTKKTEQEKAQIRVQMVQAQIDAEKSLTELVDKEDQLRVQATENQYQNIQKYLTAQEEIGKSMSQTGRVEGFQLQVAAEQEMLAYSQQEQKVLEEQLKTVTAGSDQWYKIAQQIGSAAQAQMKLRDELIASRDIVGQMGGLFGILGNLIGETGAKAAGFLSRMDTVFKQMSAFDKFLAEQETGGRTAFGNLADSFKSVIGIKSAPQAQVQQDKVQSGVTNLKAQLDKSAGVQGKYADKVGELIRELEQYRLEIQKQIGLGFSKETGGGIPESELTPHTPAGELPLEGTQDSVASFFGADIGTAVKTPTPEMSQDFQLAMSRQMGVSSTAAVPTMFADFMGAPTGGTTGTTAGETGGVHSNISGAVSAATTALNNFITALKSASTQLTTVTTAIRSPASPTIIGEGERGGGGGAGAPSLPNEAGGAPTAVAGVVGATVGMGDMGMSEVTTSAQKAGSALGDLTVKADDWSHQFASFVSKLSGWVQGLGAAFSSIAGAKTTTGGAVGGGMAGLGTGSAVGGQLEGMSGLFGMSTAFAGPIGAAVGTVLGSVMGGIIGQKQQQVTSQVNGIKEDLDAIQTSLQNNTQTLGGAISQLQSLQSATAATLGNNKKATKSGEYQAVMQQIQQEIQQLQIQQQQILQDLTQQLGILSQSSPAMQQVMQNLDQIIQKYQNFASAAAGNSQEMADANQYLIESLQQYTVTLQNQVRSANEQAISDALQLIQLQNQLNEANMQEYNILTQGVLARQTSQAMTKGMQIEQIEAQKANIQEQYNVEQYKVAAESKIFDLASTQLGLEQQMASLQEQDVVVQMAGVESEVQALMELQNALKGGINGLPPGLLSPTGGVNIQAIEQLLGLPITLGGQGGPGQPYIPNMPEAYQTFESDIQTLPGMSQFSQEMLAAAQTPMGSAERQNVESMAVEAIPGLEQMGALSGSPGQDPNWQNFLSWIMDTMTYQGYETGGMVPDTSAAIVHAGEYIIPSDVFQNFISSLNTFANVLDGMNMPNTTGGNTIQSNTMMGNNTPGIGVGVGFTQQIANAMTIALKPLFTAMGVQTTGSNSLPAFDTGGFIPLDTTAALHSGEVVMPKLLVDFISNMTGMNGATVNTLNPVISGMSDLPQSFSNNLKLLLGIPAPGPLGERTSVLASPSSPAIPPVIGGDSIHNMVMNAGQSLINNNTLDTHSQIMSMTATRVGMESDLLVQQQQQVQSDMLRISMLTQLLDRMASSGLPNNGMLSLEGGFQKLYELRGRYGSGSFRREVL